MPKTAQARLTLYYGALEEGEGMNAALGQYLARSQRS